MARTFFLRANASIISLCPGRNSSNPNISRRSILGSVMGVPAGFFALKMGVPQSAVAGKLFWQPCLELVQSFEKIRLKIRHTSIFENTDEASLNWLFIF